MTRVQHDLLKRYEHLPRDPVLMEMNRASRTANKSVLLRDKKRMDGRAYDEIRPIRCETAVLPGDVHGSALFERGDTQVLACSTFGHRKQTRRTEEYVDDITDSTENGLFVHYSFPPFATGEFGRFAASLNRREVGHSILTEKAIAPLLGTGNEMEKDKFHYALRVSAEVLASDGSSSMASVCAGSMAIMDAGGPLREPVAGIAMGLVPADGSDNGNDEDDVILTDILGAEDHFGDMDMKVTGTATGVTACQMDVKRQNGVSVELVSKVLKRAKVGRCAILERMLESGLHKPREMSEQAPRMVRVEVNRERARSTLFKERFRGLRAIGDLCDAYLRAGEMWDEIVIEAPNKHSAEKAERLIRQVTREVNVGDVMKMKIAEAKRTFVLVEGVHGCLSGILHVSKMRLNDLPKSDRSNGSSASSESEQGKLNGVSTTYPDVRRFLKVGDEVRVKVIETDYSSSSLRFELLDAPAQHADQLASEIDSIMAAVSAPHS